MERPGQRKQIAALVRCDRRYGIEAAGHQRVTATARMRLAVAGRDDDKATLAASFDEDLHLVLGVLHFLGGLGA